jgi:hypothetical protein
MEGLARFTTKSELYGFDLPQATEGSCRSSARWQTGEPNRPTAQGICTDA